VTWQGLVWKNLLRRPVRTLLTATGVALGVGLIVALLSISAGTKRTAGDLIHLGRADFGLFQSGVSDATRSLLPRRLERAVSPPKRLHRRRQCAVAVQRALRGLGLAGPEPSGG